MAGIDEIPHLKQMQARHGLAIGGIKSCLKHSRHRTDEIEVKIRRVETLVYAIGVFIAVFYAVLMLGV